MTEYAAFVGEKGLYEASGKTFFEAAIRASVMANRAGEKVRYIQLRDIRKGHRYEADSGHTVAIDYGLPDGPGHVT